MAVHDRGRGVGLLAGQLTGLLVESMVQPAQRAVALPAHEARGFNLEDSQITRTDRLDRLVLVLSLALYWAVSTGMWDAVANRTPAEKRLRGRNAGTLPAA